MPHPVIIPLLFIPHVAIPAGLFYLLYLDHQDREVPLTPDVELGTGPSFQVFDSDLNPITRSDSDFDSWIYPSPMSTYIKKNKFALNNRAHVYSTNTEMRRAHQTPMRDLASSKEFQTELDTAVVTMHILRNWQNIWKACYTRQVVRRVPQQHAIITSRLAKYIRENVWYGFIDNEIRTHEHDMFIQSPMRSLATKPEFHEWLYGEQILRAVDREIRETSPMHILALKERDNIIRHHMKTSKMRNFIAIPDNRMAIIYFGTRNQSRIAEMTSSPLRVWTYVNKYQLSIRASEFSQIRTLRTQTLQIITDLLLRNYGTLYRKYTLKEYRRQHGIPDVQFLPNCTSYANIIFPLDVQLVDRFLADSNLEGFTARTIYTDRNHFQSYAMSLLASTATDQPLSIDDLTDAALTFKNISHLTHEKTQIQILFDSTKITFPDCSSGSPVVHEAKRCIEIYFVCRDRMNFHSSDFKTCNAKITEFLKRFPKLEYKVGFVGRWLGDTMVIQITGPYQSARDDIAGKYNNVITDLIRVVNLVKGVIFQKVIDRMIWIHLGKG